MPRILDPIAAISIHDEKPRALKDKGCESPGLLLGDFHGPSLWPWVLTVVHTKTPATAGVSNLKSTYVGSF